MRSRFYPIGSALQPAATDDLSEWLTGDGGKVGRFQVRTNNIGQTADDSGTVR